MFFGFSQMRAAFFITATLIALALAPPSTSAAVPSGVPTVSTFEVPVGNIFSYGLEGDPANSEALVAVPTDVKFNVLKLTWDVNIFAAEPSWLSEMGVRLYGAGLTSAISFFPAASDQRSGSGQFSSPNGIDLSSLGISGVSTTTDPLRLQFFEAYDDYPTDWDGIWINGSVAVHLQLLAAPVPEPTTYILLLVGLILIVCAVIGRPSVGALCRMVSNGAIYRRQALWLLILMSAFQTSNSAAQSATTAGFLRFPIKGYTPETAPINSVFDHGVSATDEGPHFYSNNLNFARTIAYTGESGSRNCVPPSGVGAQCAEDTPPKPQSGLRHASADRYYQKFRVNGNYYNGGKTSFLSYPGHPGYDYHFGEGVKIYAPATGVAYIPLTDPYASEKNPGGAVDTFSIVVIDHGNGYSSWFLHVGTSSQDYRAVDCPNQPTATLTKGGGGVPVTPDCTIGKVGNKGVLGSHLHYEVRVGHSTNQGYFECIRPACHPVDPYGWFPLPGELQADPYRISATATTAPAAPSLWLRETKPSSTVLADDFAPTTLNSNVWTSTGTVKITDGVAVVERLSSIFTDNKVQIGGPRIIIEFRMKTDGGPPSGFGFTLTDAKNPGNLIVVGETNYGNYGAYALGQGTFASTQITSGSPKEGLHKSRPNVLGRT